MKQVRIYMQLLLMASAVAFCVLQFSVMSPVNAVGYQSSQVESPLRTKGTRRPTLYSDLKPGNDLGHFWGWQAWLNRRSERLQARPDPMHVPMTMLFLPSDWRSNARLKNIVGQVLNCKDSRSPFHYLYGQTKIKVITPASPTVLREFESLHKNQLPCVAIVGAEQVQVGNDRILPCFFKASRKNFPGNGKLLAKAMSGKLVSVPEYGRQSKSKSQLFEQGYPCHGRPRIGWRLQRCPPCPTVTASPMVSVYPSAPVCKPTIVQQPVAYLPPTTVSIGQPSYQPAVAVAQPSVNLPNPATIYPGPVSVPADDYPDTYPTADEWDPDALFDDEEYVEADEIYDDAESSNNATLFAVIFGCGFIGMALSGVFGLINRVTG